MQVLADGWQSGAFHLPHQTPALTAEVMADIPDAEDFAPILTTALALWSLVHGLTSLELFNHFAPMIENPEELFRMELETRLQILLNQEIQHD